MNANMQLGRGSLVATPGFEGDFLVVVGVKGSCKVPQGSCNIDINFPELFLDGAKVVGCCTRSASFEVGQQYVCRCGVQRMRSQAVVRVAGHTPMNCCSLDHCFDSTCTSKWFSRSLDVKELAALVPEQLVVLFLNGNVAGLWTAD
jgi:hypothetical protein